MSAQVYPLPKTFSKEWFDEAFTNPVTREPYPIPANLRKLAERVCHSYGISGICDPMYVANVSAFELGLGDGQSNFGDPSTWQRCGRETLGADDLIKPCVLTVNHAGFCDTGR
jgi:hypothetical protein